MYIHLTLTTYIFMVLLIYCYKLATSLLIVIEIYLSFKTFFQKKGEGSCHVTPPPLNSPLGVAIGYYGNTSLELPIKGNDKAGCIVLIQQTLCWQIVRSLSFFPTYGQFAATQKPDSRRMVYKTYIFINSNLLSSKPENRTKNLYIQGGPQKCPYFSLAITFTKIRKPSRFFLHRY